ncbi:MAG: helix-turn-helix transcriptional regulator [Clostridia bacterium]|nr:helix-turn-helix transcriptional regulator [Clostridia bacterium]
MIHAWYEKIRDQKDHIYFGKHHGWDSRFGGVFYVPAFHNSVEIAVCLEGELDLLINGTPCVLRAGEVCFINSLETHKYFYNPSVVCYVALISQSFFTDANQWGSLSFPTIMANPEGFEALKSYFEFIERMWDPESLLLKRAFADMLSHMMMRYYTPCEKREPEKQSERLMRALQYICEHYMEPLSVSRVAEKFGYSANYFSTVFNEFMETSFSDYLNSCRMIEYARIRREKPEISTVRAAEMCGFGSMNTFYRAQEKFLNERAVVENPPRRMMR